MSTGPIVMYLGGFAGVGGIETFARDLLVSIAQAYPQRELVIWGRPQHPHRLLRDIAESGTRVSGTFWRWGCAWRLPDFILAAIGWPAVRRASTVIFKRPPPLLVLKWLRRVRSVDGRRIPFVLVTPYSPGEYWNPAPQPGELENFDVIIVQSDEGRQDLERIGYRGRIETIPLLPPSAHDPVPFPPVHGGVIRLGFLGRLVAQKNLRYLLDIYQALLASGDERYELHLYGDGAQREELEQLCSERHLPRVTFHGEVPRENVCAAIDTCHLFLNTSVTEGQCLAALEILSRGRPLVATPVGALPEVLGDPALGDLAPLGDAAKFAHLVRAWAEDIRAGRLLPAAVSDAFRRRYDYDRILARYLELLSQTTSRPAA